MTQRDDKFYMSPRSSQKLLSQPTWKQWISQDDTVTLNHCIQMLNRSTNPKSALQHFPFLVDIVASLKYPRHLSCCLLPDTKVLHKEVLSFLSYLIKKNFFRSLLDHWSQKNDSSSCRNLYFYLSREYQRYLNKSEDLIHKNFHDRSKAPHHLSLEHQLSQPIIDAYLKLTEQLPEDLRLVYLLYIEGLVEEEIAVLVQKKISQVKNELACAIHLIKNVQLKGDYGT